MLHVAQEAVVYFLFTSNSNFQNQWQRHSLFFSWMCRIKGPPLKLSDVKVCSEIERFKENTSTLKLCLGQYSV